MIGEYLTSETAVHVLAGDNPLAGDRDSWNLDIKVWDLYDYNAAPLILDHTKGCVSGVCGVSLVLF